jgi:hypothetical protein
MPDVCTYFAHFVFDFCVLLHQTELIFRVCSKHRKAAERMLDDVSVSPITVYSNATNESEFLIDNSRQSTNNILAAMDLSPIRSQTRKNLEKCSDSTLRRMASKLDNVVAVFKGILQ